MYRRKRQRYSGGILVGAFGALLLMVLVIVIVIMALGHMQQAPLATTPKASPTPIRSHTVFARTHSTSAEVTDIPEISPNPDEATETSPPITAEQPTTGESASINAADYLHTDGSKIKDASGNEVRLTGLNWYGLETDRYAPLGLNFRSLDSILAQIKALGYNTIRVPFSSAALEPGRNPTDIDPALNPDLIGHSPLEIMDRLIQKAGVLGLRVILDRHRPDASEQSALWYTAQYPEQRWITDWTMLATRYKNNPAVIGFDLHNEPHSPATWGTGDTATDWRLAAEKAGNAVLRVNPNLLIFVEGLDWGDDLSLVRANPVRLAVANRVIYSPHDYPISVHDRPWLTDPRYPANLPSAWDTNWGYLVKENIAPVWIGEFGTRNREPGDQQWFRALTAYISQNGLSFAFWCLNPESSDTGGLLQADWQTVDQGKQDMLHPLLAPLLPAISSAKADTPSPVATNGTATDTPSPEPSP